MGLGRSLQKHTLALLGGIFLVALSLSKPALSAERVSVRFGPFQTALSLSDLELFVSEGKITPEFAFFSRFLTQEQRSQLRVLLNQQFALSPIFVSQLTYSSVGQGFLQQAGEVIQTESGLNGFHALRGALLLAVTDPTGLTPLNVLRKFPGNTVQVDAQRLLRLVRSFQNQSQGQSQLIQKVQQKATEEAKQSVVDFSTLPDLRKAGERRWRKQTFTLTDPARNRPIPIDFYLPQAEPTADVPLIVILHGFGGDRQNFTYLAAHLASYGYAVAVPESVGNSSRRFQSFLQGLAPEPSVLEAVNQPQDVTFLLNEFQRRAATDPQFRSLNLQRVGVVGHSFGGQSALLLAGAPLDLDRLRQRCQTRPSPDTRQLAQCPLTELPGSRLELRDRRIVSILAFNPSVPPLLDQPDLAQIQVPTLLLASSSDVITPPVDNQIRPFSWLTTPNRYLALIENGTHVSFLEPISFDWTGISVPPNLIGSGSAIAQNYARGLAIAFFRTHLNQDATEAPYLSAAYTQFLSQPSLKLSLVTK